VRPLHGPLPVRLTQKPAGWRRKQPVGTGTAGSSAIKQAVQLWHEGNGSTATVLQTVDVELAAAVAGEHGSLQSQTSTRHRDEIPHLKAS
jgi:hypothetical protein